jgi:hypothetical protein
LYNSVRIEQLVEFFARIETEDEAMDLTGTNHELHLDPAFAAT